MSLSVLPTVNAILNGTCSVLLITGFVLIRRGRRRAHRNVMLAALLCSASFLVSYLTYHWQAGTTRYPGEGWLRVLYLSVLASHTVLAALVPPMAALVVWAALRGHFETHRRYARRTLPVWLYVSATGVIVYLMLYPLRP